MSYFKTLPHEKFPNLFRFDQNVWNVRMFRKSSVHGSLTQFEFQFHLRCKSFVLLANKIWQVFPFFPQYFLLSNTGHKYSNWITGVPQGVLGACPPPLVFGRSVNPIPNRGADYAYHITNQGRNWLPKTGWASSNAACRRCPPAPSILPKTGWAIAHPAHSPVTPL